MTGTNLPTGPLTADEIHWLRKQKLDAEHAAWAWRMGRRWIAYFGASITAAWGFYEWVGAHITFKGGP